MTGQRLVCITCAVGSLGLIVAGLTLDAAGVPTVLFGGLGLALAWLGKRSA